MDADIQDIAAIIASALKEYREVDDAFNAESEIFEHQTGDTYVGIEYKGCEYRIEVIG